MSANNSDARGTDTQRAELGHVLFMDFVGFSKLPTDEQPQRSAELKEVVRASVEFQEALRAAQLIPIPTGDGMALVFLNGPEAAVKCAVDVALALRDRPALPLRMGIHCGPFYRLHDINTNLNVAGSGINFAQRVMDFGDAGHILLSRAVAEFLGELSAWRGSLKDLGEYRAKHDAIVYLYNLVTDKVGNPSAPEKVRRAQESGSKRRTASPVDAGDAVLFRVLGVSHRRDARGREELQYATQQGPFGGAEPPRFVPVHSQAIRAQIERLRKRVDDLTHRALVDQRRGLGVEDVADELARLVLPPEGLVGILGPGVNPQFDIIRDAASSIPWEVLEESFFRCPRCHAVTPPDQARDVTRRFCSVCGHEMDRKGGKLALTQHVTHLTRGCGQPPAAGKRFLIIEDPTGELTSPERDPNGVCRKHLGEVRDALERMGYERDDLEVLAGAHATPARVLGALTNPEIAGVYYFGHGYYPRDAEEGCLQLAGGMLYASQIAEAQPTPRFVFLNACEGAAAGRNWDLESQPLSVAEALAGGHDGKVVIAPLWPVVNVQAAEMAGDFFRWAARSMSSSEALAIGRANSFARYDAGEPHLGWMAYRYLGDPNRTIPCPSKEPPRASRVFDRDGRIALDAFAFSFGEILVQAASRRNDHGRRRISVADLVAGLVRKGDLTRLAIAGLGALGDEIYERIGSVRESDHEGSADAGSRRDDRATAAPKEDPKNQDDVRAMLARLVVRDRQEFSPEVVRALEFADDRARARAEGSESPPITERDVLEAVWAETAWTELAAAGLPDAAAARRVVDAACQAGDVDDNGGVCLDGLDADARRVVETAHGLAQQRGLVEITMRLTLASFLANARSHAARRCREDGVDPERLRLVMVMATEVEAGGVRAPRSFGLSVETCNRIILPMIKAARRRVPAGQPIGEAELFAGFSDASTPSFRKLLLELRPPVSLEMLAEPPGDDADPLAGLDEAASRIVRRAHELAQKCGRRPIPNRLLLAAFLEDPEGPAVRLFRQHNVPVTSAALHRALLEGTSDGKPGSFPLDRDAAAHGVTPMVRRAAALAAGRQAIDAAMLFRAFCQTVPWRLRRWLAEGGVNLDLLGKPSAPVATEARPIAFDRFDTGAQALLSAAADVAQVQGWSEIRTPHLFAAMVDRFGASGAWARVHERGLRTAALAMLGQRTPPPTAPPAGRLGRNAYLVLQGAIAVADREGRRSVDEQDIVTALFAEVGGAIGKLLRKAGVPFPGVTEKATAPSVSTTSDSQGGG